MYKNIFVFFFYVLLFNIKLLMQGYKPTPCINKTQNQALKSKYFKF